MTQHDPLGIFGNGHQVTLDLQITHEKKTKKKHRICEWGRQFSQGSSLRTPWRTTTFWCYMTTASLRLSIMISSSNNAWNTIPMRNCGTTHSTIMTMSTRYTGNYRVQGPSRLLVLGRLHWFPCECIQQSRLPVPRKWEVSGNHHTSLLLSITNYPQHDSPLDYLLIGKIWIPVVIR